MALTNFIPQLWSARLLEHLHNTHVYANLVNRDYQGEITRMGDTVKINQIGAVTVGDYVKNTDMTAPQTLDGVQTTLVIDQAKFFNFQIDDVDDAQTNPKLMDKAMLQAGYALADVTDKFIADLYTDIPSANQIGNNSAPIELDKTNVYDYLVDLGVILSNNNVPKQGRFIVVPPFVTGLLNKSDLFTHSTQMGDSNLTNGMIARAGGFDIYESNNVPNTSNAKYKIMAGTSIGISFAEQVIETEAYRMEKRFSDAVKGLHVYGAKMVQPKAMALLTANIKTA